MGIHTTDAIVLRHYPYRETSALVTCLTDRYGKIKGLIKGLRAAAPRFRSAMEPLTVNRIVFYDTRISSLHLVTQCELLEAFCALPADLELMRLAASCAELTDVVVETEEPHPGVFPLLYDTLRRLATGDPSGSVASHVYFILRLLRLAGFQPQVDECTGCGQRQPTEGFWSPQQGGLLCARCLHQDPHAEPIDPQWLGELIRCAEADGPPVLDMRHAHAISQRLEEFLRWRLDRPLKTLKGAARPGLSNWRAGGDGGQGVRKTHAPLGKVVSL